MFCYDAIIQLISLLLHLQYHSTNDSPESRQKTDGPTIQKRLDAFASSLNYIGGTIGNALEVGFCSFVFFSSLGGEDGIVSGLCHIKPFKSSFVSWWRFSC